MLAVGFWFLVVDNMERGTRNHELKKMKISIITVCYNSDATIRDAVDSVLEQN